MNIKKKKEIPPKRLIGPLNIFVFGNSAQTIEFDLMLSPRFNFNRNYFVRDASSPRDADVLLVFGPVNHKTAPALRRIYELMNGPKWVVCIAGNVVHGSYSLISDISEVVPVDLYINKLNPSPLDIWNALGELK